LHTDDADYFWCCNILLLSGFFVEEALAQVIGSNGGIGGSGTTGTATNGGLTHTNGNTTNSKNGASANGHSIDGSGA